MSYYDKVYAARANRYGMDYQSRIQNEREQLFDKYLLKTIYRVDFLYNSQPIAGSLEPYKQDDTKTLQYLLVNRDTDFAAGTILSITDFEGTANSWMIMYLEEMQASGYNRYVVLKMTHSISWKNEGTTYTSLAYMHGKGDSELKATVMSSRGLTIFPQDENSYNLIMPRNQYLTKDTYLEIGTAPYKENFRVTGYDIQSTIGVSYVTLDPVYYHDQTPAPTQQPGDDPEDFYWITGGGNQ